MDDEIREDNSQKYRSGYLKRLELQNFMCHRNYSITFSPRLNVITGQNGSGKSAILHGILLALAAERTTAGRGSFARAIKFGEKWARTRLVIDNSGVNALPEWGDEIIIERLLETNKSSFKITGSSGRKEKRRKVVERICTDLTLNINNPCVVLTQEQSKQLFANTDGKKRMEFLASATQLAQTEEMMKRDIQKMKVIEENNKEKTELRESLGRKYKSAKKRWIEAKKLQESDSIIKKLRDSKVYLEVDLLRKNWANNDKEIRKYSGGVGKCLEAKSSREEIISKWKKLIQTSKEEIAERENSSEPLKDEKDKLDSKKVQAKRFAKEAYQKLKQFDRAYKQLEEQLQKNQSRKQSLLVDLEKELGKDSAKLRKDTEEASAAVVNTATAINKAKEALNMFPTPEELEEKVHLASNNWNATKRAVYDIERSIDATKRQIHQKGGASMFHSNYNAIKTEMTKMRFEDQVVGPLGMYIKLQPQASRTGYVCALECLLNGRVLTSWVVANMMDCTSLRSLLHKYGTKNRSGQIWTPNVKVTSATARYTEERLTTNPLASYRTGDGKTPVRAYDMIHVQNDWVHNVLVDSTNLESTWFVDTVAEGQEMVKRVHSLVRHVTVFTKEGDRLTMKNGNIVLETGTVRQYPQYLVEDYQRLLAHYQKKLRPAMEASKEAEDQYHLSRNEKAKSEREKQAAEAAVRSAKAAWRNAKEIFESKSAELNDDQEALNSRMRKALEDHDREEDDLQQKLKKCGTLLKEAKEVVATKTTEFENVQKECRALKLKTEIASNEVEELRKKINDARRRIKREQGTIGKINEKLAKWQPLIDKFTAKKEEIEAALQRATDMQTQCTNSRDDCAKYIADGNEELDNDQRTEQIENLDVQIESLEERKRVDTQRLGNVNALFEEMTRAKKARDEEKEAQKNIRGTFKEMSVALKKRKKDHKIMTRQIIKAVRKAFMQTMQMQGHDGVLTFDDECKSLNMELKLQHHDQKTDDVKCLSGGEKSWTQLCFLLSISQTIDTPVSILDEFDVFMDGVNREASVKCLMEFTKRVDRQFIFITPNDVRQFKTLGNKVKIHKVSKEIEFLVG